MQNNSGRGTVKKTKTKAIAAAALGVVVATMPVFVTSMAMSVAMSQMNAVLEAMEDDPEESETTEDGEDDEDLDDPDDPDNPDKPKTPTQANASSVYYDIYHAKADCMMSNPQYKASVEALGKVTPSDGSTLVTALDNASVYVEIYRLLGEICARDEINPGITTNMSTDGRHSECRAGVITPQFIIGKICSESGFYNNVTSYSSHTKEFASVSDDSHPTDSLYWFSRNYVAGVLFNDAGEGLSSTDYGSLASSNNDSSFRVFTTIAEGTSTPESAPQLYADVYSKFYNEYNRGTLSTNTPGQWLYDYSSKGNGVGVGCAGPCGQSLLYSYNFGLTDSNGNARAAIYISKAENSELDDAYRAIWGLRSSYYKLDKNEDKEYYSAYVGDGSKFSSTLDLNAYESVIPHAKYLNSSDVWGGNVYQCESAYYSDIKSFIKEGNMYLWAPMCYKSRPATYYFPDSVYTLCLNLRQSMMGTGNTMQGSRSTCVYDSWLAGADNDQLNDCRLYLAAANQYTPGADKDAIVALESSGYIPRSSGDGLDSSSCGKTNLEKGDLYAGAFRCIIDDCWNALGLTDETLNTFISTSKQGITPEDNEEENEEENEDGDTDEDKDTNDSHHGGGGGERPSEDNDEPNPGTGGTRPSKPNTPSYSGGFSRTDITDAGFSWPVSGVGVNDAFSLAGLDPYLGNYGVYDTSGHSGVDIPVGYGTSVHAAAGGTVMCAQHFAGGIAYYVAIKHANGLTTGYMHLSDIKVSVGQNVNAGDEIGESGDGDGQYGAHLHFEVMPGYGNKGELRSRSNLIDPLFFTYNSRPKFTAGNLEDYYNGNYTAQYSGGSNNLKDNRNDNKIMGRSGGLRSITKSGGKYSVS